MGLKFQNPNFNILHKIASWNKQKWPNIELITWSGLPRQKGSLFDGKALKMINYVCKKISDQMEPSQPVFIIPSQLGKHVSPLHKMSLGVGQPVLGLHILRNLAEEEINMVAINTSKMGPIICVNS